MIVRVVPQFTVLDIAASERFYADVLGFTVSYRDPPDNPDFLGLERDEQAIFLVSVSSRDNPQQVEDLSGNKPGVGVRVYLEVADAHAFYEGITAAGCAIHREIVRDERENYTEFSILDPDGYEIGIYS